QIVEAGTGRLLGTVDAGSAHTTVHEGAVHLHSGGPRAGQRGGTHSIRPPDVPLALPALAEGPLHQERRARAVRCNLPLSSSFFSWRAQDRGERISP
ncbi:hypothetical protein ABZ672_56450, partial [Streptomyces mirabilis]|uniref:hypothetical protein n=1 Tax=Streptomyces mirabilis TaxID=68239 RepID=UPI0033C86854